MLGLRFSRLVHAAIASGALVLAACPDGRNDTETETDTETATSGATDDPTTTTTSTTGPIDPTTPADITPPALLSANLLDNFTLQLTFTEPIAPVDTVNPKRFRLSFAVGDNGAYNGGQAYTRVVSTQFYNYEEVCIPCYYYDPYCYYGPFCYYQSTGEVHIADLVNHYADASSLILFLDRPIQPSLCRALGFFDGPNADAVLHLHYADGGLSQVTDLAGLPLAPDGRFWVAYDGYFYTYHAPPFSNFTPFVPIPCPF